MAKSSYDFLYSLIKSLSPSDKRHFRLSAQGKYGQKEKLFMQLFDVLDKQKTYDETKLAKKIPGLKNSQLSNLKANLYRQILTSLRKQQLNNNPIINLREILDFALVLYNKGMYKASLNMLEKAKKIATNNQLNTHLYLLLEIERKIESQHITGSTGTKATQLIEDTNEILAIIVRENELANLSIFLYGSFLNHGYVKTKEEFKSLTNVFEERLPKVKLKDLGFKDKQSLYKSYVWYFSMVHDFANNYKFAKKWLDLFYEYPEMISTQVPNLLKAYHNVLAALYMTQRIDKFDPAYEDFSSFEEKYNISLTQNEQSLYQLFRYIHGINSYFITADYHLSNNFTEELIDILEKNSYNWDDHRILVLYYKIGCISFGQNNLDRSAQFLNKVTNDSMTEFGQDIQCYARILNLIVHFDLGNDILVGYMIKSVYRFLLQRNQLQKVLQEIFKFLRRTPQIKEENLKSEFKTLRDKLYQLKKDPFERRPFLYLDIISWLDSKICNVSMQEAIKKNMERKS